MGTAIKLEKEEKKNNKKKKQQSSFELQLIGSLARILSGHHQIPATDQHWKL